MPPAEIGQRLGRSAGAVRQHIHKLGLDGRSAVVLESRRLSQGFAFNAGLAPEPLRNRQRARSSLIQTSPCTRDPFNKRV